MAMRLNENLDDNGEMHEINVTPFIDVMLVLLIIFMVAAPLATVDVKVNLPASSSQPQPRPEKPIYLSVKADKSMFLGNDPVTEANMINALDSLTAGKKIPPSSSARINRRLRDDDESDGYPASGGLSQDWAGGRRDRQSQITRLRFCKGWPRAGLFLLSAGDVLAWRCHHVISLRYNVASIC